jgi:hypothetical protein
MVFTPVPCPYCQSEQVIKRGKTDTGKQRYRCQNPGCSHQPTFRIALAVESHFCVSWEVFYNLLTSRGDYYARPTYVP